ncbi:MAG: hypothetical protein HC905_24020 [Bacteroidales bacterium]|nr:hypothetical protein [Bacteroidales bacterium]
MKINWLYNPFTRIAGVQSLLWGLLILLVTAFLGGLNNVHYDGVIDMHAGMPAPMLLFLLEVIVSWLLFSVLLLIAAKILSRSKVRVVDIFGTQAFAKYPYLVISLISFIPYFRFEFQGMPDISASLIIFGLLTIVFTIWTVVLMYNAFSVSANLSGGQSHCKFHSGIDNCRSPV